MIGVTVTEWKPKLIQFISALIVPELLRGTSCQSTRSLTTLPSLALYPPSSLFFLPSPFSIFPVWIWADPPTLALCPPPSYESHVGQGPRGCQGLLMTPSPAITSGWQLYLHKTSGRRAQPARSDWHSHKNAHARTCATQMQECHNNTWREGTPRAA